METKFPSHFPNLLGTAHEITDGKLGAPVILDISGGKENRKENHSRCPERYFFPVAVSQLFQMAVLCLRGTDGIFKGPEEDRWGSYFQKFHKAGVCVCVF